MKFFQLNIFTWSLVITSFVFSSCKREIPQLTAKETDISNGATLQVFNATVKSVRNYVYVDGMAVSGAVFIPQPMTLPSTCPLRSHGIKSRCF